MTGSAVPHPPGRPRPRRSSTSKAWFDSGGVIMEHTVEAVMTSQVVTARPATPFHELVRLLEQCQISALTLVADAGRLMLRLDVKRLPVVDARGGLAGIVARSDLLKVFLRPDPAVRWEVDHDIVRGEFGIADGAVQVEVRDGVVGLRGRVERRGQAVALVRRVRAVDGVAQVDAQLTWRIDDQVPIASRPVT